MSEESLPLRQWPAGIRQASVPANENALRVQALLSRALSVENDAPGTEYNGAVYIVGSAPTGAFSTFSEHDIALFEFGSWYAWAPPLDTSMVINDVRKVFDGTEWVDDPSIGSGVVDTDDVPEGAGNLYFTAARVRDTLLTGLSLASSAVISATDSVLSAFGKLQAQITALASTVSDIITQTITDGDTTHAPSGDAVANALAGKEPSIAAGTTGQFWRGDKVFANELIGKLEVIQDYLPGGEHGLEVSMDSTVNGSLTHASVTSTTYGLYGGGTFHGRGARGSRVSPSAVLAGDNFGGIGGRPFHSGGDFFHSSPVSAHWVAKEDMTPTNAGSCWRMLTTKVGSPQSARKVAAVFADDGDFIVGEYDNNLVAALGGRGLVVIRENSPVEQSQFSFGASGFAAGIRMIVCRGAVASPSATQAADGAFFGLGGHDGVSYQTGAASGVFLQAFNNWSPTSRPATITFSTTTDGTTTRVARWYVWHSGEFLPAQDNTYDVGGPINRIRTVYAATGTINTSDAREKTTVRQLSAKELAAAKALSGEVGTYQWLAAIEAKGADARLHIGLTVQRAIEVMEDHGLDPFAYGFICHDQWEEQTGILDEDGEVLRPHVAAGDRYSFRMDELCLFLARGQEERLRRLEQAAGL